MRNCGLRTRSKYRRGTVASMAEAQALSLTAEAQLAVSEEPGLEVCLGDPATPADGSKHSA